MKNNMIGTLIAIALITFFLVSCEGYKKKDGKIYYRRLAGFSTKTELVDGCDFSSFKKINKNYSKDKNNVFYRTSIIDNADPLSFKQIEGNYYKDNNRVYYFSSEIQNADPTSFIVLKENFGKDNKDVYYKRKPLSICSIENYELLDHDEFDIHHWSKDGCFYYYKSYKIPSNNYEKMVFFKKSQFSKDDKYIYDWQGKINYKNGIKTFDVDVASFNVDESGKEYDKFGFYDYERRNSLNRLKNKKLFFQ